MSTTLRECWEALYRQAEYRVLLDEDALSLRIGQYDAATEHRLRKATGFQRACAIVTACNPRSESRTDEQNRRCTAQLRQQIDSASLMVLPTLNCDPSGTWPEEPGFLIVDGEYEWLTQLGRRFGQNAIVLIPSGQAPSRLWLV